MLKVGLIGCGGIGAVHAQCWLALKGEVQLTAIADVNTERTEKFAKEAGAKVYADGMDLLEKESLDVVDICVPTFLHARYVIKAAECVKNVIVEKPVCLTEDEAEQMLEARKRTGALIQVAHVLKFYDEYIFLKEMAASGQYGRAIAGYFNRISPRPMWMVGHDDVNRTGSMYLDMHIHDVDFIRYLLGEPDEASSWDVRDDKGVIQHIWSSFRYGEALMVVEGSWDYPENLPFCQSFRVRFEKAAVVLDEAGKLTVYPEGGEAWVPELGAKQEMNLGINVSDIAPYLSEIRYFVETIKTENRESIVSLNEAVASFRLVKEKLGLRKG